MKRKLSIFMALVLLMLSMTACGSASFDGVADKKNEMGSAVSDSRYDGFDAMEESVGSMDINTSPDKSGEGGEILTGEKLVYTCDLKLQTLNYEESVRAIKENIQAYKGIIERESESDNAYRWYYEDYVKTSGTRNLSMTIRIPSGKYSEFLDAMEGTGKVISRESFVKNISRQYYETDAYIKSLEIQQDRLLDMMEKAVSIEDMITIEARLSEVQYELNIAKTKLSSMDADVEYSTITIVVQEVLEYTPDKTPQKTNTFWDRLQNTLTETWEFFWELLEGLLFMVIRLLPVAIVVGAAGLLVLFIIRCCKKSRVRKRLKTAEQENQEHGKEK